MIETIKTNTNNNIAASKTPISEPNVFQKLKLRFSVFLPTTRIFPIYKLTRRLDIKLKRSLGSTKSDYLDDHSAVTQLWSDTHRHHASLLLTQIRRMEVFWIKIGQYLSSRADIMPPEYLTALAVLQDRIPPKDFEGEIVPMLREELGGDASTSCMIVRGDAARNCLIFSLFPFRISKALITKCVRSVFNIEAPKLWQILLIQALAFSKDTNSRRVMCIRQKGDGKSLPIQCSASIRRYVTTRYCPFNFH